MLVCSSAGSLAAVIAESDYAQCLTWLSFAAAFIEVIIQPIANWSVVGSTAERRRKKWIDVREQFDDLWRIHGADTLDGRADIEQPMKRVIALEKENKYVPTVQWLVDFHCRRAEERRGVIR